MQNIHAGISRAQWLPFVALTIVSLLPTSVLAQRTAQPDYGRLPLSFEANVGQTSAGVRFLTRGNGYSLFLTPTEAVFRLQQPANKAPNRPYLESVASRIKSPPGIGGRGANRGDGGRQSISVLRMSLAGANPDPKIVGQAKLPGKTSYFIGAESSKWHRNVATYRQVRYCRVYPGVDLIYYGNQRQLEYDFVVAPKADPSKITLRFAGASQMSIDGAGDLAAALDGQTMRWHRPLIYQESHGRRVPVRGRFALRGPGKVGFVVATYDRRLPLVIDPVLSYSTYLGGSAADAGNAIAVDRYGSAYIAGYTNSSDFPGASSPRGGRRDAFITRLDRAGSTILYSTYVGGSEANFSTGLDVSAATGIKIDDAGIAYVTGYTTSPNFPTRNGFQSALTSDRAAFVAALSADGADMLYGTLFGGSDRANTDAAGIALDPDGHIWITGTTTSHSLPTSGGFQSQYTGNGTESFVAKFDTSSSGAASLVASTYFTAGRNVTAAAIAMDPQGAPIICGSTRAIDLPTTENAFQVSAPASDTNGSYAFVTKFSADCRTLLYSTYLSSTRSDSGGDYATGVVVDPWGFAYVTGFTYEKNFPTVRATQPAAEGGPAAGFLCAIDLQKSGTASLAFSTYLGGRAGQPYGAQNPQGGAALADFDPIASTLTLADSHIGDTRPTGIALDAKGNPYVTGSAEIVLDPTGPPGPIYFYSFVEKFASHGSNEYQLLYSVLFGDGLLATSPFAAIAVDPAGNAYVTGKSATRSLLTTPGTFQSALAGDIDAFAVKLSPRKPVFDRNGVGYTSTPGDGMPDLLFQNRTTGDLVEWLMQGAKAITIQYHGAPTGQIKPGADSRVVGMADFTGDQLPSFLMQHRLTNNIAAWSGAYDAGRFILNDGGAPGIALLDAVPNPGENWRIVGTGDFDADGHPDILFQNGVSGDLFVWYTGLYLEVRDSPQQRKITYTHGAFIEPFNPGAGWCVAAVADLDQDGQPDILFQNSVTGDLYVWYMNGAALRSGRFLSPANPGMDWKLTGIVDLNLDGQPDLIFQNQTTGMLAYWLMHNADEFQIGLFDPANPGADWKLVVPK